MSLLDCQEIRTFFDYSPLLLSTLNPSPVGQYIEWYHEALKANQPELNTMVLSTVQINNHLSDKAYRPEARSVLLKEISESGEFIFYTNYQSHKAQQIKETPAVSLLFYWGTLGRQIRIQGLARKLSPALSEAYFATRSRESQLAVYASHQSQILDSAHSLDKAFKYWMDYFQGQTIPCPSFWGGYAIKPEIFEFFQGRPNRLHDRFLYQQQSNQSWTIVQLAP